MMRTKNKVLFLGVAASVFLAGCQELMVPNQNNPDRERALVSPADVETLIASSWRDLWTYLNNTLQAYNAMPIIADELTATYANDSALELSSEPRVAFNNDPTSQATLLARAPWEGFYKGISSANDGMAAINNGLVIRTNATEDPTSPVQDNTTRAWAFAKLMSGILHGHVAMMYDQMFVVHETRELPEDISKVTAEMPLVGYQLGVDSAVAYILEAIDTMQAKPFIIPSVWIPHRARTSEDLIQLGHAYIAQILVYSARTPQERADVDWARVLYHAERGMTEEFFIDLSPSTGGLGIFHNTLARAQQGLTSTFSSSGDYKLIGAADVSGAYAEWLNKPLGERDWFDIVTPDRRITGATPTSTGMYFRYRTSNIFNVERGLYHRSRYQSFRKYGGTSSGVWYLIPMDELNLIRAEALYRLNRRQEAADMVNISRTRNRVYTVGASQFNFVGLPAVTADGVPQSDDCVPRMDGVTCANLLHAIQYERMIEGLLITGYRAWMDSRGWGRLPPGAFLHFPIPGRELVALGLPIYSFGGVGGEGAATCPAGQIWCQ
jgi:hypothetical protein